MGIVEHNNDVIFFSGRDPYPNVRFDLNSYSITNGQPWDGVSFSGRTITVKAGRHKTKPVAEWFKKQFPGADALRLAGAGAWGDLPTNDAYPEELNFAIRGTLSLGIASGMVVLPNVVLGQGSWSTENNWWITGAGMTYNWNSELNPKRVLGATMHGTQNGRTVNVQFEWNAASNQFPFTVS